ncbi:MAG: hypothetical protein QM765_27870 [Myxococcales bacterium]
MRSSGLLAAVLAVGLSGCLQAVDLDGPDGNAIAGQDASHAGLDATVIGRDVGGLPTDASILKPDASVVACVNPIDCPPVVQTDPACNPIRATCVSGKCGTERIPRVWDNSPGACQKAEDCGCQSLPTPNCIGSWLCTAGKCGYQCGGCTSDLDCVTGEVCQEVSCGSPKQCIAGCRDGAGCPAGTICDQFVNGKCGEPYGQCLPEPSCQSDSECPKGSVCDFEMAGGGRRTCQTGCRDITSCGDGEECIYDACPKCVNCPCHGQCQSKATCKSDAECSTGEICTDDASCTLRCVAGCRTDADCRADQYCPPTLPCVGCGCAHPTCEPRPFVCTDDAQCGPGQICTYDDTFQCSGDKHCKSGCLENADCPAGEMCALADCGPCCPGWCIATPGCQADDDCAPGYVCEAGAGCQGTKSCVPGCRVGSKPCLNGGTCLPSLCVTCPCPDVCTGSPACAMNQPSCSSTLQCEWQASYCDVSTACCQYCPIFDVAPCPDGQCMYGGGVLPTGCPAAPFCAACCACPAVIDPVCGENYQTYGSSCEANCAGVAILHTGACQDFEGMDCQWGQGACASGQYCRDTCPMCDLGLSRCTKAGTCVYDWDCPAGGPSAACPPNQHAVFKCETTHTCRYTCQ